jgi:hypothetical protein
MGLYVHIHVAMNTSENEPVAKIAQKYLALLDFDGRDGRREAKWYLEDLAKRTGQNVGPKGGLSLWGMVGNYTPGAEFCEILRPFWKEILEDPDAGPCEHHHILVFVEREQTERATAYEIFLDESTGDLQIKFHDNLPFGWHQY